MKIIPAIDLMDGKVVRLYKGDPNQKTIYSDNPNEISKKWENAGADMLHIVDLDATLGRGSNISIIEEMASKLSIPFEVAGGLRDESIIQQVLEFSPRVVLGTLAFKEKKTLKSLLEKFGKEKIVISADHLDGKITVNGWQTNTDINLINAVKDFLNMGFSEFLVTNVSRDGTMQGPDLNYLEKVCSLKDANIIASGGISNINDVKLVKAKNAFGVILGKALYENQITIEEAKKL
ncbi:MAG: 1-(5-phosphoribosyl)-5-[(5-phosphoribosylamino)methylideneamino]imidazole-4-carboxamide isomerase [Crenarchaeota archaeon]|nr:MAG: 1-(5-phosphoribosyl)-5-[(5-phosphoribosylamino)methylideneamino]imidazole-4-carboxamide isomerase [Thermoproteota archaeon]RDJ33632.1 MAG: 1-(5-phosphoribosyl)-5-[(5-phosphoribosylamino)methylideneamino]imidazole-4-carboxamide isomerase [Thermoproteota archaeon]RDJ36089.1 MAG: 1-(5-phosphoribosyl)-5-[(5-phosphoribosylamino)methylideneamino]imidazole-4-carboxamide isomerase [Thermoproteota archaeon]RDJ38205.1 MAG: 1-(5-phosphoribosyl)-5-[(5-phosphoribosylamino)methylideneamino]imidazole-4